MTTNNLYNQLLAGGFVMIPLGICSLLALAIIIERSLFGPSRNRIIPRKLLKQIVNLSVESKFDEIRGLCRGNNSSLAKVVLIILENTGKKREEITESVMLVARKEITRHRRYLGTLAIIANISPLLGLLGTVFGMIKIFAVVQAQGVGDAFLLAGGISEALITTATGLTIAIPSLVFYRYFNSKAKALIQEIEEIAVRVINNLPQEENHSENKAAA